MRFFILFTLILVAGCQQPVVINPNSPAQPNVIERRTIIVPQQPRPQAPPARPNIQIDINNRPSCSPSHRCGRCDDCRRHGIRIEIK